MITNFPAPWWIVELPNGFAVEDATGKQIGVFYGRAPDTAGHTGAGTRYGWTKMKSRDLGAIKARCDSSQLSLPSGSPLLPLTGGAFPGRAGRLGCWRDRMTPDRYDALERLADVPHGIAKTLMLAYGFTHELVDGLVLAGLATVAPDIPTIGEQTVEVELVMITDAG